MIQRLQRVMGRITSEARHLAGRSMLTALFVTAEVLVHLDLGARWLYMYARAEHRRPYLGSPRMVPAERLLAAPPRSRSVAC